MRTPNKLLHEFEQLPTAEPTTLEQAAELLWADYFHDQGLTALLFLDSEPFQPSFEEQVSDESSQNSPIS